MKLALILTLVVTTITIRPQPIPNDIVFTDGSQIYVIRTDGTGQTAITAPADGTDRPRWSRDGRQIVFTKGNCYPDFTLRIWKMNADGSNQTALPLGEIGMPWQPVFSPNADRIAYVAEDCVNSDPGGIAIEGSEGSNQVWVTGLISYAYGLDWAPSGESLVYAEFVYWQNPQFYRINSINTNGTGNLDLTTAAQGNNFDPVWSPDGSKIAFVSYRDGNSEIYTMNSDGSNQARITNSAAKDLSPTWSPDGTKLAFTSDRNGPFNIYVMNADGTNTIQITHNAFDSLSPHWNPSAGRHQGVSFDFDGDGRSDIGVRRPSDNTWLLQQTTLGNKSVTFGVAGDVAAPADFDGDGQADIAVFRPSNGTWYVLESGGSYRVVPFGQEGDVPAPGDHDGDGRADLVLFRPSNGTWYWLGSTGVYRVQRFGEGGDVPVPGDYDGDAKNDLAVWRPSDGTWYVGTSGGVYLVQQFGQQGDIPAPGDYDGDGKADRAVWRPSDGSWYVHASTRYYQVTQFGEGGDVPVPADYDGDGKTDLAIFRPSTATWFIQGTSGPTYNVVQFGQSGDRPVSGVLDN